MKLIVIINGKKEEIDLDVRIRQMENNDWKGCPLMTQVGGIESLDLRLKK